MSKHLKDHTNAPPQTPHPDVQADTRQQVAERLNEVAGKIARGQEPDDDDLNSLCEILYLSEVGLTGRGRLGRVDC